jgi:hypothetical protein
MTVIGRYANGKLELGSARVQVGPILYNFTHVFRFFKYVKQQPLAVTVRDQLQFRTNNLVTDHDVSGQVVNTQAFYMSGDLIADTNFPATPSSATLVMAEDTLRNTPIVINGGGAGKTRIVGIVNTDSAGSHTVRVVADGDDFPIPLPPLKGIGLLLVETPSSDNISIYDPDNSGYIRAFVVETDTANANVDTYTRTFTELDVFGNPIDSGSDSGQYRWFFLGAAVTTSSIIVGGGGFTG